MAKLINLEDGSCIFAKIIGGGTIEGDTTFSDDVAIEGILLVGDGATQKASEALGVEGSIYSTGLQVVQTTSGAAANAIANIAIFEDSSTNGISILTPDIANGTIFFGTPSDDDYINLIASYNAGDPRLLFRSGGTEWARFYSGALLIGTTAAGASKLVVNDDSIQINTSKTPASAGATGTQGQVAWDSSYIYVCVATDTWERTAIASW